MNYVHTRSALLALAAGATVALGQAAQKAAFVGNNGNIEGSVTSYTFSPSGVPQFVAKVITGSGSNNPGNNVYGIALSPDGRYLATTHATASTTVERVTMFRVNADATLTHIDNFSTPDSPLDAVWLRNDVIAITRTNTSLANLVYVYRFDGTTFTLIDQENAGTFTAYLELSPDGRWLVAADSTGFTLRSYRVELDGTLTPGTSIGTGTYVLDPGFTREGRLRLYGGGGISGGSNRIPAFDFNPNDGSMSSLPNAPYTSPGSSPSPKLAVHAPNPNFMIIGHGTSAEIRVFAMDPTSGDLTDTGFAFDVGIQGSLGTVAVLGEWILATDNFDGTTGLYSFSLGPNGQLNMNGTLVSSQGTAPRGIAPWNPPATCYANCDGSTGTPVLTANDFQCFLNKFANADPYANCDGSTGNPLLTANDFQCFLNKFANGCS
jgi:6-phosphogluconolactonase (cycloisomerase 2 family)